MTKKDYVMFAKMFSRTKPKDAGDEAIQLWEEHVKATAEIFHHDNMRFDYTRFLEACTDENMD